MYRIGNMAQRNTDDLSAALAEFEVGTLYNYVFSHLTHMIQNIEDRQMKIYYCEKIDGSDKIWKLWNVPATNEFDNPDFKPVELLLHWVPNKYDAGNIFRIIIAKILTYHAVKYGPTDQVAPSAPPPDTPDKDNVTPGVA